MSQLAVLLVKLYLSGGMDPCEAQRVALHDFEAVGICTWDAEVEDGDCTDLGNDVLRALWIDCHPEDDCGE